MSTVRAELAQNGIAENFKESSHISVRLALTSEKTLSCLKVVSAKPISTCPTSGKFRKKNIFSRDLGDKVLENISPY